MFREFTIGELFTLTGLKQVKSQKNIVESETGIPFVIQSTKNNMVKCHVDKQALLESGENVYDGNVIVLGVTLPAVSYQETEFGASQVITARRDDLNSSRGLYIVTVMRKALLPKYSYTNKPGIEKYKEDVIQLPVKEGTDDVNYTQDDIDWDYMESTIRELEESTIRELEESIIRELDAYLKETGLNDYHLTDAEHALLDREPMFCAFSVTTVFDVINTKSIRKSDIQEQLQSNDGSIPYITASDKNNAVAAYIECPQEWIDKGNCIFIGGKTTTITYQLQDFCSNDSHNLALYLKNEQARTERIQLYLVSILKKAFANKYQWSNALSKTRIKAETIQLPVKLGTDSSNYTQDDIDWDYMESYNRVMEKRVIADVVDYKNEVIALTEECVSDN